MFWRKSHSEGFLTCFATCDSKGLCLSSEPLGRHPGSTHACSGRVSRDAATLVVGSFPPVALAHLQLRLGKRLDFAARGIPLVREALAVGSGAGVTSEGVEGGSTWKVMEAHRCPWDGRHGMLSPRELQGGVLPGATLSSWWALGSAQQWLWGLRNCSLRPSPLWHSQGLGSHLLQPEAGRGAVGSVPGCTGLLRPWDDLLRASASSSHPWTGPATPQGCWHRGPASAGFFPGRALPQRPWPSLQYLFACLQGWRAHCLPASTRADPNLRRSHRGRGRLGEGRARGVLGK